MFSRVLQKKKYCKMYDDKHSSNLWSLYRTYIQLLNCRYAWTHSAAFESVSASVITHTHTQIYVHTYMYTYTCLHVYYIYIQYICLSSCLVCLFWAMVLQDAWSQKHHNIRTYNKEHITA